MHCILMDIHTQYHWQNHMAWASPGGVLLLGGDHGPALSELTDNTGHAGTPTTNTGSFQLEYSIKWVQRSFLAGDPSHNNFNLF